MNRAAQWCIYIALIVIGIIALLVIAADDAPYQPMSELMFISTKFAGLAVFYLCIKAGNYCRRQGWLPETEDINDHKEDKQ